MCLNVFEFISIRTSGVARKSVLYSTISTGGGFRISEGVGHPALGRPEGAGFLRYRTHVLVVQASGFPKPVGRSSLDRPSDVRREPEVRVIWLKFLW